VFIKLVTLNRFFDGHRSGIPISYIGTCCDCGGAVEIQIDRVAGGYGLQGGALHEIGNRRFVVRCETCHQVSSKPDNVGKLARLSGYFCSILGSYLVSYITSQYEIKAHRLLNINVGRTLRDSIGNLRKEQYRDG
jgi:hypothetical protein